jgi:hypothetical protein
MVNVDLMWPLCFKLKNPSLAPWRLYRNLATSKCLETVFVNATRLTDMEFPFSNLRVECGVTHAVLCSLLAQGCLDATPLFS